MKKIFSVILSVIMAFSACTITAISASAANVVSPEKETTYIEIDTTVNDKTSVEITYTKNPNNPYEITFTYTGNGVLEGWTFIPDNVTIILEQGNSITILVNAATKKVIANAIIKSTTPDEQTTTATAEQTTVPAEQTTASTEDKTTSPATGAVALSTVAITGAGIAALALLKKKNDAE